MNTASTSEISSIKLRLKTLPQLFNSFDSAPFPERDLDRDAEAHIVAIVREIPAGQALRIARWSLHWYHPWFRYRSPALRGQPPTHRRAERVPRNQRFAQRCDEDPAGKRYRMATALGSDVRASSYPSGFCHRSGCQCSA
jgi:hypothetical protein